MKYTVARFAHLAATYSVEHVNHEIQTVVILWMTYSNAQLTWAIDKKLTRNGDFLMI